jgi:hypothetical protein
MPDWVVAEDLAGGAEEQPVASAKVLAVATQLLGPAATISRY